MLGIAWSGVVVFQVTATAGCVVLATIFKPASLFKEKVFRKDWESGGRNGRGGRMSMLRGRRG